MKINQPRKTTTIKNISPNQLRSANRNLLKGRIYSIESQINSLLFNTELLESKDINTLKSCRILVQQIMRRWNPHFIKERFNDE